MLTKDELPPCPVATTLMLIGNKWKIFIIQQLMEKPFRFGELRRAIPGISEKVLTDNLRAMEKDGLITRTVFPEIPPHTEYALSDLGETMRPIIESMATWGTGYQNLVRSQEPPRICYSATKSTEAARCPVPMPGGTGTLEEVSGVISLLARAQLDAPCILFNLNGFYDDLRALLNRMSDMGLSSPRRQRGIHFAHSLEEVADILAPLH